jgi:hypothetical protein
MTLPAGRCPGSVCNITSTVTASSVACGVLVRTAAASVLYACSDLALPSCTSWQRLSCACYPAIVQCCLLGCCNQISCCFCTKFPYVIHYFDVGFAALLASPRMYACCSGGCCRGGQTASHSPRIRQMLGQVILSHQLGVCRPHLQNRPEAEASSEVVVYSPSKLEAEIRPTRFLKHLICC